jgi:hypothetical protein
MYLSELQKINTYARVDRNPTGWPKTEKYKMTTRIKMYKKLAIITLASSLFAGCASVPMDSKEESDKAKKFTSPANEISGLYIYRASGVGTALKKDVWVNDECVGETAPNMFFYELVEGDKEHKLSTESEFSPNDLLLKSEGGKNYYIKQYIKLGVFVGGANLELVDEESGQAAISKLELAKKGTCSK